jgi:hypothetical protein
MRRQLRSLALVCGFAVSNVVFAATASAATFLWQSTNRGIVVEPTALRQTKEQVTVRARGYTVEFTNSSSRVFGPFPTRTGVRGLKIFGVDIRRAGGTREPLGLMSQPLPGIAVAGSDAGPGVISPTFDSGSYLSGNRTVKRLEMAVFEFSRPVRVSSVGVVRVTNGRRDVWVAGCSSSPALSRGLTNAIRSCTVRNGGDVASGGVLNHSVNLPGVRFLLVGARPVGTALGPIRTVPIAGRFLIDSINFTK